MKYSTYFHLVQYAPSQKMNHPALGRIQKYPLRQAFDGKNYQSAVTKNQLLPDSVLYREKEQFADGMPLWTSQLQEYAKQSFPGLEEQDAECALYDQFLFRGREQQGLELLLQSRKARRRQGVPIQVKATPGRSQPVRWYPVGKDPDLAR